MRSPFFYGAGGVLSGDIAVPEHEREVAFYVNVLTTGDNPLWKKDLMNNLGQPVIGLGPRAPEYEMLPVQWMPHFQVESVAGSAEKAVEKGGKVLMQSDKSDDGELQWAVITDPFDAAFGLIPAVPKPAETEEQNLPIGCISWLSLSTPDANSSSNYYQDVLGWNAGSISSVNDEFQSVFEMTAEGGQIVAEIHQPQSETNAVPNVWLLHLPVDDFDESIRQVAESDGEVVKTFADAGYAVIRDPVGVHFALRS